MTLRGVPLTIGLVTLLVGGCAGDGGSAAPDMDAAATDVFFDVFIDDAAARDANEAPAADAASPADAASSADAGSPADAVDAASPADAGGADRPDAAGPAVVKVMSFNLRHGDAPDGENAWELRKPLVFDVFKRHAPDLVGTQEGVDPQLVDLDGALPGYRRIGVARNDGVKKGEYSAIYYRVERFAVDSSGTFWLSDTPEVPGSKSWGNTLPRICTWGHFTDKATGDGLYVFNVHLDQTSQPSREKGVALMMKRAAERPLTGDPVIVTGDFNAGEDNLAVRFMKGEALVDGARNPLPLVDSFRALYPDETQVRTSAGFSGGSAVGAKIDYIFMGPGQTALTAQIDRTNVDGRYPSDHYPVTATIRLPP
jgi:endonuclease/exonuclease/phosphatase family metal-dependent hydrolase